jgi:hypothetical protein
MNDVSLQHNVGSIRRRATAYLSLTTIAIAQPLLQMYGDNIAIFTSANYEGAIVVWFALAILLLPPTAMIFFDVVATRLFPRHNNAIHLVLVFVGAWVLISMIFRTITFGQWPLDILLTATVAIGVTALYHRLTLLKSWLSLLSPVSVVVLGFFVLSASSVITPPAAGVVEINRDDVASLVDRTTPSKDVSVLWITLDEAPLFALLNTQGEINANRFPGFAELAQSSTWYRNALATSQMTIDAVPAMLTGKWPRTGVGPVLANHPNNLFTLMNGHLAMDGHEVATALCPRAVCSTVSVSGGNHIADPSSVVESSTTPIEEENIQGAATNRTKWSVFFRDASVVLGHKVLPAGLREKLPPIDEGWGGFGAIKVVESIDNETDVSTSESVTLTTENLEQAKSTTVRQWQTGGPMSQVSVVEDVITRASRADRPTLHFAHVLLPHRPWMLAPDMRRSRVLPTDKVNSTVLDRARDEYQALLFQYAATDSIIKNMLSTMKKSANWNRTIIIVTADHGITFTPGAPKRTVTSSTSVEILEDLYRVPMFIKYPDQMQGIVSDCPASSIDLLATVISATGVDAGWETDGTDLFSSCPERPLRKLVWRGGSTVSRSTFSAAVERARYYDKWVSADGTMVDILRVGAHGALVGTDVSATAPADASVTWSINNANDFQSVGGSRFGLLPWQVIGNLKAQRDMASDEEALLMLGDRVVGVVSESAGLLAGETVTFKSNLHWESIPPGKQKVTLWIAGRDSSGKRTLTPQL